VTDKKFTAIFIIAYISVMVEMFVIAVILTHGPEAIFQTEPAKTFGELQRNPAFWYISAANTIITILSMIWIERRNKFNGVEQ